MQPLWEGRLLELLAIANDSVGDESSPRRVGVILEACSCDVFLCSRRNRWRFVLSLPRRQSAKEAMLWETFAERERRSDMIVGARAELRFGRLVHIYCT